MKAFPEWILSPSFIVRVGPEADQYGKPFEYAIVVKIPWFSFIKWILGFQANVVIKGLVSSDGKRVKPSYAKAVARLLTSHHFRPTWERIK